MIRRLVLLLVFVAGTASAASPTIVNAYADLASEIDLVKFGQSKAGQMIGPNATRSISGGTFIKWGGTAVFGAVVAQQAMQWAHEQGLAARDAALDRWWTGQVQGVPNPPASVYNGNWTRVADVYPCPAAPDYPAFTQYKDSYSSRLEIWFFNRSTQQWGSGNSNSLQSTIEFCGGQQTLSDFLKANPNSGPTISNVMRDYVNAHPETVRKYLEPLPNDNQWLDDACADPVADSDVDGVPDCVEFKDMKSGGKGDPNNKDAKPATAPYETGRVTTTSPDGKTTTTTITYSDGTTATITKTKTTTTTTNPTTGEVTETTTTTTTTTAPNAAPVTTTHTVTVVYPKPSPGSPMADDDNDGIPNKDDPDDDNDGIPDSKDDNNDKANPQPGSPEADDDNDGIPNKDDPDDDNDGKPDAEDDKNDKANPQPGSPEADDDNDGIPNKDDPDDDNDGKPDAEDDKNDKAEDKKNPVVKEVEKLRKEQCEIAGGTFENGGCTPKEKEKDKEDQETPNTCGDFSPARLMKYPGSWAKDLIIPCEDLGDIFAPLRQAVVTKFPFSLTSSLSNLVSYSGSGSQDAVLPSQLGPFELNWSWLSPLIATVGLLFKSLITWLGINAILSRLMGQLVIK